MKISGQCGRLLCCLSYEFDWYNDARKNLPSKNILWPPSLVTQTLTLGSSATLSNAGSLDAASLIPVLLGSLGSGAVCWILLALAARRGLPG